MKFPICAWHCFWVVFRKHLVLSVTSCSAETLSWEPCRAMMGVVMSCRLSCLSVFCAGGWTSLLLIQKLLILQYDDALNSWACCQSVSRMILGNIYDIWYGLSLAFVILLAWLTFRTCASVNMSRTPCVKFMEVKRGTRCTSSTGALFKSCWAIRPWGAG